jgi:hypothetical protein
MLQNKCIMQNRGMLQKKGKMQNKYVLQNKGILQNKKSRDSSVGIVVGYGLDNRGSRIRFPMGAGNFSLHHRVHNGSGVHLASYPMGTRGSFPVGKAASA